MSTSRDALNFTNIPASIKSLRVYGKVLGCSSTATNLIHEAMVWAGIGQGIVVKSKPLKEKENIFSSRIK